MATRGDGGEDAALAAGAGSALGHWQLLQCLGGTPRALVRDNESAVGSWRDGRPRLTAEFEAFRGLLGIRVIGCRPRDPEAKGLVERANGYLETSLLPGWSFTSPGNSNAQLEARLPKANAGKHRSSGCRPTDRFDTDRASMLPLPPLVPTLGWRATVRLPRDDYVRLSGNDYSVPPSVVGRRVEVSADLDTVTVRCDGRVVGEHHRCWAKHQTITDPAHRAAAEVLRELPGTKSTAPEQQIEERSLLTTAPPADLPRELQNGVNCGLCPFPMPTIAEYFAATRGPTCRNAAWPRPP